MFGPVAVTKGGLAVIPHEAIAPFVEKALPFNTDPVRISIASWAIIAPLNIEFAVMLTAPVQNQYTFFACVPFTRITFEPGVDAKAPNVLIINTASGLPCASR